MSSTGPLRSLEPGYENPSPFKANCRSPMFDLPGGCSPSRIRADPAHTYHIGYGKDENASIIMMLVKVGHFGARGSVDKKLDDAFERFAIFCKNSRKHTSIVEFSKKLFKINKGLPVSKVIPVWFWYIIFKKKNPAKKSQPPFSSHLGNPATHAVVARGMTLRCWGPGWKLNSIQSTCPKLTLGGIRRSKCLMMSRPFQTYTIPTFLPRILAFLTLWRLWSIRTKLAALSGELCTNMGCFFKEVLPEQLSLRVGPWWILDLKGTSFCNEPRWYMCIIFCVVNTSVDQVKEGFACLSSLTASKGLALFRIRPKLHMAGHIVFFDVDPLAIFFGEWWFFVWPGNMFQHIILYFFWPN